MSLTVANSIILLTVPLLFPIPQQLQGYDAEDVFDVDDVERVETKMGIDGKLSGGYVAKPVMQTFTLQADSASNLIFEALDAAQVAVQEVYQIQGIVRLPATSRVYTCTNGFLTKHKPMPSAGKLLKPRKFTITWENVSPAPA